MRPDGKVHVIVLAAQREGRLDPLAEAAGVTHKCLVPIDGKPLLAHVLDALATVDGVADIAISVEPGASERLRAVTDGRPQPIRFAAAASNIADSVYVAAEGADGPVVVTTGDNVLLTPAAVREVVERLVNGEDAVTALARKEAVLSAHPEAQRRFYRFRDGEFSNCNLYGLSRKGLKLAETFREGGQFAKNPMRIARALGFLNLVRLRYGLVSLDSGLKRLGKRFGVTAGAVVLPDGAHAVDVDNQRTYDIAALLLAKRAAA